MTLVSHDRPNATAPSAINPSAPLSWGTSLVSLQRRRRGYDVVLALAALALALIGAVLVWAATRDQLLSEHASPNTYLCRHLLNLAITVVLAVLASRLDARLLKVFGPLVYIASIGGLLLVFVIGSTINGAHAWIQLGGGFELQPSEFMKLGLIVGMAVLFAEREAKRLNAGLTGSGVRLGPPPGTDVLLAIGLIAIPLGLIIKQPDLGSAMVLAATSFGILVAADVRARWIIGLMAICIGVAVFAVKSGMLAEYQIKRFLTFLHPNDDLQNAAYNIHQAHIAIANGGIFGRGLFHGPQTNGGFVPEQRTDFIFSVAGEEFGLLGGLLIIALFVVICWRGLRIAAEASRAGDLAGRLVAVGIVSWLAFQAFENVGMTVGLMPVTGLPLPFVSYGGSSMFAQGLAIGLLEAVHRRNAFLAD
jgi:rod shape determining protein RodA